jgi:hypothetical protein
VGDGAEESERLGAVPAGAPPIFFRSVRGSLRILPAAAQRFWILVIATGVLSGLASGALLAILGGVQRLAWPPGARFVDAVSDASPLRRVLVPALAGAVVGLMTLVWRRPLGGHGTARIIEAIWSRGRGLQLGPTLLRGLVSVGAVAMGASLGREGALVQTGAAAGSWLARRLRVTDQQARVVVACGAASGIAAAYVYSASFEAVTRELAQVRARVPAALHLAGGPHASAAPLAVLRAGFDLCALGEGEETLPAALLALARGGDAAWLTRLEAGGAAHGQWRVQQGRAGTSGRAET